MKKRVLVMLEVIMYIVIVLCIIGLIGTLIIGIDRISSSKVKTHTVDCEITHMDCIAYKPEGSCLQTEYKVSICGEGIIKVISIPEHNYCQYIVGDKVRVKITEWRRPISSITYYEYEFIG